MRLAFIMLLALSASWGAPGAVLAEQSNSCQQCSDQRRPCSSNCSAKTCQTAYDRCTNEC
jgi:hypothetical protein